MLLPKVGLHCFFCLIFKEIFAEANVGPKAEAYSTKRGEGGGGGGLTILQHRSIFDAFSRIFSQ